MNNVLEIKCRDCGETIIFSKQAFPGHQVPSFCLSCRQRRRALRKEREAVFQKKQRETQTKKNAKEFENEIKKYSVVDVLNLPVNAQIYNHPYRTENSGENTGENKNCHQARLQPAVQQID